MPLMTMFCRTTTALLFGAVLVIGSMSTVQPVQGQSRGSSASRPPASNGPVAQAAYQDNSWSIPGSDSGSADATSSNGGPNTVGGYGVLGRLGHITGPAVGHNESFSFLEVAPYSTFEENFLAADFRVLRTNRGFTAMSGGVVARHFLPAYNSILGANAFFDVDETRRGTRFQQAGFGIELLTENFDVRTNFYYPTGEDTAIINSGIVANSSRFNANQILFDGFRDSATSTGGVDMMFTVPVPGRIAESINLETSAGWYLYNAKDSQIEKVNGWKLRADTSFADRFLHIYAEFSEDGVFDKNVLVGADINYWHKTERGPRLGANQYNRIAQWVERQWTVTTVDQRLIDAGLVATNPDTGNPYFIEHVNTTAAGVGTGTFEDPYMSINSAFTNAPAAGPDNVIFVHGVSSFTQPITLGAQDRVFGEGITHTLAVSGFSSPLELPAASGGGRPIIDLTGVNGDAVTMADGATFAGFVINNVTNGNGISINGVNGSTVRGVDINTVTGRGIEIVNSSGAINLFETNITGTTQESLFISGGSADITLGTSSSTNPLSLITASSPTARAVHINNAAGSVNLVRSSITTAAGSTTEGVLVDGFSTASVEFGNIALTGGTLDFLNIRGATSVSGDLVIDDPLANAENPNGVAINIFDADARVGFASSVIVNNRINTGISIVDTTNAVVFSNAVNISANNGAPAGAHAVEFAQSSGDLLFNGSLTIADSPGAGINVNANNLLGSELRMAGPFSINNTALSGIRALGGPTVGILNGGDITNRVQRGIELAGTSGAWTFNGQTNIDNGAASLFPAVEVNGVTGDVAFNQLVITASRANIGTAGLFVDNSNVNLAFADLQVSSAANEAIRIQNSGDLAIGTGVVRAINGRAVTITNNNSMDVIFDSIGSTNSPDFGILVANTPGSFTNTGVNATGVITSAGFAGAVFDYNGLDILDSSNAVRLNNLDFNANDNIGILADGMNTFELANSQVRGSVHEGVVLGDRNPGIANGGVLNVRIADSIFTNNGTDATALGNGRRQHFIAEIGRALTVASDDTLTADQVYTYVFERNIVTDQGFSRVDDDAFLITTVNGGQGAILNLRVGDNTAPGTTGAQIFTVNRSPLTTTASAFRVNWEGEIRNALVQNTTWNLQGGVDQVGFDVQTLNTTESALVIFQNNRVIGTGNAATGNAADRTVGANFDFSGPATLNVLANRRFVVSPIDPNTLIEADGMSFSGFQSRGIQMSFRADGNNVLLEDNNMLFSNDNGVGFFVPINSGTTTFAINRNTVRHNDPTFTFNLPERFFDVQTVLDTLTFVGTDNNIFEAANGALQPFPNAAFFPAGSFSGSFLINGITLP